MKTLLTIIMLVMAVPAWAEQINLAKIAQIESSGNPLAHNKKDDSRGLYQITKIALDDFNMFHRNKLSMDDMWDSKNNEKICSWMFEIRIPQLLKHFKIKDSTLNRIAVYNWGIGNVVKWQKNGGDFSNLPLVTRRYYEKYVR